MAMSYQDLCLYIVSTFFDISRLGLISHCTRMNTRASITTNETLKKSHYLFFFANKERYLYLIIYKK